MSVFRSVSKKHWGSVLIMIGVAAWIPYAVLKHGLGYEVAVYPFLTVHLLGVIPGFLLRRGDQLWRLIQRRRPSSTEG